MSFYMNRRRFLSLAAGLGASAFIKNHMNRNTFLGRNRKPYASTQDSKNPSNGQDKQARTRERFYQIMERARKERWPSLPVGECMGKIGLLLARTEYVPETLEGEGPEICRVDLTGLDCVTFYENVLCMARILRKGKTSFENLVAEITFTRYRGGKLTDYTSRLHYTSDWIYDNELKKVVKNITREIGGEKLLVKVSFMSRNPESYPALRRNPEFIETIARTEEEINKRQHWYITKRKIKEAEKHIQTGDIVAMATSKEGLDYGHAGLAYRDNEGRVRFLHASLKEKKVILDRELFKYVNSVETHTGITIARPL
jgi:hypothetical protein